MKRKLFRLGMVTILVWVLSLFAATGLSLASADGDLSEEGKQVTEAVDSLAQATGTDVALVSYTRKQLFEDIYKYTWILKVGPGQFDKIGVYRVVKEKSPGVPIAAPKAVMMNHGDASNFDTLFLCSTLSNKVPKDQSLGIYLAKKYIDVWGVDRRWTFVPDGTTDFSFMKNWNTALHVRDIRVGVKLARLIRGSTGSGAGKLLMLGISRGAQFTYAYANAETQLPDSSRDLKGIIPMEMVYKFSPQNQDLKDAAYQRYLEAKEKYDQGIYYSDEPAQLKIITYLAATAPDDPSPVIPGFTNKQAALFLLSATYLTTPLPPVPYYHYLAGKFDSAGIPTDLTYTTFGYALDLAAATPGYMSIGEDIDGEALWSDKVAVPYDDYLSQIKIPALYIGAAGGFGEYGVHTLSLLGSTDKNSYVVKLYPSDPSLDYGHADPVWANNAKSLVWPMIYGWIAIH
ncbi:MAG: hypothetical protein AB1500_02040 [Bacillota bacterium]